MSEQRLEPRNELEEQLAALRDGVLAPERFFRGVLGQQVFMPVKEEGPDIQGFQASQKATPLSLESEEGVKVLILFTAPERAVEFLRQFEGYKGGILENLGWVLRRMGAGYGVAINPGWDLGIDLDEETVAALAAQAAAMGEEGEGASS